MSAAVVVLTVQLIKLSVMTFSIMTLSIMPFSIITLNIMTISTQDLIPYTLGYLLTLLNSAQ